MEFSLLKKGSSTMALFLMFLIYTLVWSVVLLLIYQKSKERLYQHYLQIKDIREEHSGEDGFMALGLNVVLVGLLFIVLIIISSLMECLLPSSGLGLLFSLFIYLCLYLYSRIK